jgi:hypothetical protein
MKGNYISNELISFVKKEKKKKEKKMFQSKTYHRVRQFFWQNINIGMKCIYIYIYIFTDRLSTKVLKKDIMKHDKKTSLKS